MDKLAIPFKVFLYLGDAEKPEVRRFDIEGSTGASFYYVQAKLQDVYPSLKAKSFTISWKDEEGDDVLISSDDEMMIALAHVSGDLVKLYVHCKNQQQQMMSDAPNPVIVNASFSIPEAATTDNPPDTHTNVICDGCEAVVVGFRYKCINCVDYDLCSNCESAGMHPEHCMVRIPGPTMPREMVKKAIKCSRKFLKTVSDQEDRHKRRERSGDRKHHFRGERHERHERRECRRPRGSWLETFSTYMNEFANLAGDVDCHPPSNEKPQSTGQASANTQANPNTQAHANTQTSPNGPATTPVLPSCNLNLDALLTPEHLKYIAGLQKTLAEILVPNLVPEQQNQANANQATTSQNTGASNASAPNQDANVAGSRASVQVATEVAPTGAKDLMTDVEMGQGDRKNPEVDKASVTSSRSSMSSVTDNRPMEVADSTDKGDEWTMINKDTGTYLADASADLMDVAGAPAAPIGFNLPEEFQARVRTTDSIYPPLHPASAVLDPKMTTPVAAQVPSAPQATPVHIPVQPAQQQPTMSQPAQTQPAPRAGTRRPFPNPKIEAALQQMLNMGFNNESGWLTQLLETYHGNIEAVLDVLTPVAPPKK